MGCSIRVAHIIKKGIDTGERTLEIQGKTPLKLTEAELHALYRLLKFHYEFDSDAKRYKITHD